MANFSSGLMLLFPSSSPSYLLLLLLLPPLLLLLLLLLFLLLVTQPSLSPQPFPSPPVSESPFGSDETCIRYDAHGSCSPSPALSAISFPFCSPPEIEEALGLGSRSTRPPAASGIFGGGVWQGGKSKLKPRKDSTTSHRLPDKIVALRGASVSLQGDGIRGIAPLVPSLFLLSSILASPFSVRSEG